MESEIKRLTQERDSWQQEYKLAAAANKQFAASLDKKCDTCPAVERIEQQRRELEIMLFAVIRNSCVLPIGIQLKKTEEEISEKVFETIDAMRKQVDFDKMTEIMNRATRRKGGNNE